MQKLAKKLGWLWIIGLAVAIAVVSWQVSLAQKPNISHPLDLLTANEIKTTIAVIRQAKNLSDVARFANISLQETQKNEVLEFKTGLTFKREAFVVVLEPKLNKTYEAVVDLKASKLNS